MNHHLFYKMKNSTGICLTMSNGNAFEIDPDFEPLLTDATNGAPEKHIPVLKNREDKLHIRIGQVPHPSLPKHHIEWIYVETSCGGV